MDLITFYFKFLEILNKKSQVLIINKIPKQFLTNLIIFNQSLINKTPIIIYLRNVWQKIKSELYYYLSDSVSMIEQSEFLSNLENQHIHHFY